MIKLYFTVQNMATQANTCKETKRKQTTKLFNDRGATFKKQKDDNN